jgi:hypothetical protein
MSSTGSTVIAKRTDCEKDKAEPTERRRNPRQEYEAGVETERPQADEDEDVEQRRRLQIKGRRLHVLQMEGPDQPQQQQHVHDY